MQFIKTGALAKILMFLAILSAPILFPAAVAQAQNAEALAHWTRVLGAFVNDQGQVDFQRLAKNPADLNAFVDYIAKVSPESAPALFPTRESTLAYHINAYNALSMYNVIDSGIPKSLSGLRKVWFFGFKKFPVGGKAMSLYAYENDVIRPMGDARIHFALNCMAVGCPRLPTAPFMTQELDKQLDREARRFFAEPRNLELVLATKTVRLSEILKFYQEDFLRHSPNLIAYVSQYTHRTIPEDYQVEFIDYDWTVNVDRANVPRLQR